MSQVSGKKVLIVDDEEKLRSMIAMVIEYNGAIVSQASNGVNAFEMLKKQSFDIVVTDIRMPNGDGISLIDSIQNHFKSSKKPHIVVMTAFSFIEDKALLNKGASLVMKKPFLFDQLVGDIDCLLSFGCKESA